MASDDFVPIHSAPNPTEQLLLRSLLEGSGIEVRLEATNATGVTPKTAGSLANSEIFVRAADAQRARELIMAADEGKLEPKPDPSGTSDSA